MPPTRRSSSAEALTRFPAWAPWTALLLLDLFFLRWVVWHFENWGFWDWDYQQSLLETTRIALLEYGQLPLWNPYIGGGVPLAGNSLSHAFAPSILPILAFGTIAGSKVVIGLYLVLSQIGMKRLAEARGLGGTAPWLAAIIFSLGGVYAHRLTHGHFEWIAIAWMPFILASLHASEGRSRLTRIGLGGLFYGLLFLDGGPYQFAFFTVFALAYAGMLAATERRREPILNLVAIGALGAGLAALKVLPVLEVVSRFPRKAAAINFYAAPFEPTALQILSQMWVSTAQQHNPEMWMPFVLNVGSYVGWGTLALVGLALIRHPKRTAPPLALALAFLWLALGPAAPIDFWQVLHSLPFFSALRVPTRFNVFVLLLVALVAAEGLTEVERLLNERFGATRRAMSAGVAIGIAALIGIELGFVNGEIFRVAFSIPPIAIESQADFQHMQRSPYLKRYQATALYAVHPNWPGATFPAILENRGVLRTYRTIGVPTKALASTSPIYRGEAFMTGEPRDAVRSFAWSPNHMTVDTDGRAGKIVFNQNFDPGWRALTQGTSAPITEDGRLAVKVEQGTTRIEVTYRPPLCFIGAFLSATTLGLLCLLIFWPASLARFVLR